MKLIDEWRKAPRMLSMIFPTLNVSFIAVWATLPEKFQESIPPSWVLAIAIALIVCGMIGRLVEQPKVSGGQE